MKRSLELVRRFSEIAWTRARHKTEMKNGRWTGLQIRWTVRSQIRDMKNLDVGMQATRKQHRRIKAPKRVVSEQSSQASLSSAEAYFALPWCPCVFLSRVSNLEAGERVNESARGSTHLPHPPRSHCRGESSQAINKHKMSRK